jgi:hypothetical protein
VEARSAGPRRDDEGLSREHCKPELVSRLKRMTRWERCDERLVEDRLNREGGLVDGTPRESDVESVREERFDLFSGGHVVEPNVDVGQARAKRARYLRQTAVCDGTDVADSEGSDFAAFRATVAVPLVSFLGPMGPRGSETVSPADHFGLMQLVGVGYVVNPRRLAA